MAASNLYCKVEVKEAERGTYRFGRLCNRKGEVASSSNQEFLFFIEEQEDWRGIARFKARKNGYVLGETVEESEEHVIVEVSPR